jgi:hypothetical protein
MPRSGRRRPSKIRTSLLQLVEAVRDAAANEREVVSTLVDWLERGVRPCALVRAPVVRKQPVLRSWYSTPAGARPGSEKVPRMSSSVSWTRS